MLPPEEIVDRENRETRDHYQASLRDGYRALAGVILATSISEAILLIGRVGGDPPLVFALIGLVFAARHLLQIWQAKQQLKQHPE